MRHHDDADRMRRALSKLPVTPDPADAFSALDKKLQPDLWRAWVALQRRVAAEAPNDLREWPCNRIAAAIWINTIVRDIHHRVRRDMGGSADNPNLPDGAEECMQQVHDAAEAMLSALLLTTLEHVQAVQEGIAANDSMPECPACELEARFTDVLRAALGALGEYHTGPPPTDDDIP